MFQRSTLIKKNLCVVKSKSFSLRSHDRKSKTTRELDFFWLLMVTLLCVDHACFLFFSLASALKVDNTFLEAESNYLLSLSIFNSSSTDLKLLWDDAWLPFDVFDFLLLGKSNSSMLSLIAWQSALIWFDVKVVCFKHLRKRNFENALIRNLFAAKF